MSTKAFLSICEIPPPRAPSSPPPVCQLPCLPLPVAPSPLPPSPSHPPRCPLPNLPHPVAPLPVIPLPVSHSPSPPPCLPLPVAPLPVSPSSLPSSPSPLPLPIAPSQSPLPYCPSPRLPPTPLLHVHRPHSPHLPTSLPAPSPCILIITCTYKKKKNTQPQSGHATTIIEFLLIYSSKMTFEANGTWPTFIIG